MTVMTKRQLMGVLASVMREHAAEVLSLLTEEHEEHYRGLLDRAKEEVAQGRMSDLAYAFNYGRLETYQKFLSFLEEIDLRGDLNV